MEKTHIDTSNLLREKILALEQQDRSYQEALDLKTQENLSLLERVRLLESDNLHLLNENRALSQEMNFIKSIPPPPPIIKEIPVREIREIPPPIREIPPPRRENIREFPETIKEMPYEENFPSSLKHDRRSYDDLLDKFERFIEKNERENGRKLKKALFEVWRLKALLAKHEKNQHLKKDELPTVHENFEDNFERDLNLAPPNVNLFEYPSRPQVESININKYAEVDVPKDFYGN